MKSSNLAVVIKGQDFAFRKSALNNKTECLAYLLKKTGCATVVVGVDTSRARKYVLARVRRCLYIPIAASLSLFTFAQPCLSFFLKTYNALWISFFIRSYIKKNTTAKAFILYDDFQVSISSLKLLVLGTPCVFICCFDEWAPACASNRFLYLKGRFIVHLLLKLCDGCFAISSYISNKILEINASRRCLHLPALSDVSTYLPSEPNNSPEKFKIMYSANIAYQDQLNIVLQGYLLFKRSCDLKNKNSNITLNIVLSGNDLLIKKLQDQLISKKLCNSVKIYNNLSQADYACLLHSSSVLLCPLSDSVNNAARFPQKLAEYSAAYGLIAVSPVGDVKLYFTDMVDSVYLYDFTPHSVFMSLQTAFLLQPCERASLRNNARRVFDRHFSIDANVAKVDSFLAKFT